MSTNNILLQAALCYLTEFKFPVFPCNEEKKSLVSWGKYRKELPTEEDVKKWWTKWPNALIGVATGNLSGLLLMDSDSENALKKYSQYFDLNIETPTVRTGGGGFHYYFKFPQNCKITSNNGWYENADSKGEGGYSILPPSKSSKGVYKFIKGRKFRDVELKEAPLKLIADIESATKEKFKPTKTGKGLQFSKGGRDDALFSVSNALVKGGMDIQNIETVVTMLAKNCDPPFSEAEAKEKIDSALKRTNTNINENRLRVRTWVSEAQGLFKIDELLKHTGNIYPDQIQVARLELQKLSEEGIIAPDLSRNGYFRKVDVKLNKMTKVKERAKALNLWWPLKLHEKVIINPGSLILIQGVTNAGKSAFFLNFVEKNMLNYKIRYVTSEWSNEERDSNLEDFGVNIDKWDEKVDFILKENVETEFSNYIDPDNITIIDYIEIYNDYHNMAGKLRDIANQIGKGIAIVAVQKKDNSAFGYGGQGMLNRTQLCINIDVDENEPFRRIATIRKLKKPVVRRHNIERLSCSFEYGDTGRICNQGQWGKIVEIKDKDKKPVKTIQPEVWANMPVNKKHYQEEDDIWNS